MTCIECGLISKYKCPVCRQPYCSVACYKKHKETPCSPTPAPVHIEETLTNSMLNYEFPTAHTVPLAKLKLLENSKGLQKCLENPHVRKIIKQLEQSPHPDALIQEYMQEPIFTELVDECLKVVNPPEEHT